MDPITSSIPDAAQIITGVGTFLGSAFAAYLVVKHRTHSIEKIGQAAYDEVKPTTNGEKTLRADVQHILVDVRDLHDDIKSMRVDLQGVGNRLYAVERDVLAVIRESQARGAEATARDGAATRRRNHE
jgi:hypothetical protein